MIRLGYVGLNTLLPTASKTFRLSNYTNERMLEVANQNISALLAILEWNEKQHIKVFRITSQLIPFGSHPINSGTWQQVFAEKLRFIGRFIQDTGMQVSLHPGQYTVLNSPTPNYYQNAVADLEYHASLLSLMGLDDHHRMVIHGGGSYGNKTIALQVLTDRLRTLPLPILNRLMIENDDVVFTAEDILTVCQNTQLPAVLDVLHHQSLPSYSHLSLRELICLFNRTWEPSFRQKIHYSNQDPMKPRGAHSTHVDLQQFGAFYEQIEDLDVDIMLEVKDKEQSVLALRRQFPLLR